MQIVPLQASPIGQSVTFAHGVSHVPPAEHTSAPVHIAQEPPPVPHALEEEPDWHMVPSQHPPLHSPGLVQLLEHVWLRQASNIGQSVGKWHLLATSGDETSATSVGGLSSTEPSPGEVCSTDRSRDASSRCPPSGPVAPSLPPSFPRPAVSSPSEGARSEHAEEAIPTARRSTTCPARRHCRRFTTHRGYPLSGRVERSAPAPIPHANPGGSCLQGSVRISLPCPPLNRRRSRAR